MTFPGVQPIFVVNAQAFPNGSGDTNRYPGIPVVYVVNAAAFPGGAGDSYGYPGVPRVAVVNAGSFPGGSGSGLYPGVQRVVVANVSEFPGGSGARYPYGGIPQVYVTNVSAFPSPVPPFTPLSIANLYRWFSVSALAGLADGALISAWIDRAGSGQSLIATGTARPIKQTVANIGTVVRFDGSDDKMALSFGITLPQPLTIIAVAKYTTTTANKYIIDGVDTTNRIALITTSAPGLGYFAGTSQNRAIATGDWRIWTAIFKTSPDLLYVNDGLIGSGDAGSNSTAGLTVGARWDSTAGSFLGMDITDILIYTRELTRAERRTLLHYFVQLRNLFYDPNRAGVALNASTYQTTPTYDSSGQMVHPDIYYNAAGWNGYKYWMVCTPYTGGNNQTENPSLLVSNDGDTWIVPPGFTNPLVPWGGTGTFNSDCCCIYVAGTLYWYYRTSSTVAVTDVISVVSSTDGVAWSAPSTAVSGTYSQVIAPSVIYNPVAARYEMYHMSTQVSPYGFYRRTASTPTGTWSAAEKVNIDPPSGQDLWHITVFYDTATSSLHALCATLPSGTTGGTPGYLYLATSNDGAAWVVGDTPLLAPGSGAAWDNYEIYRTAGVRTATGYDIWYSARGPSNTWHIGRSSFSI